MAKQSAGLSLLAFAIALSGVACSSAIELRSPPRSSKVYRIDTGIANVYLLHGEGLVMIDGSTPEKLETVLSGIADLGFSPAQLRLVVMTHGHADHGGNGRYFQETYRIPVAGGAGDLDKFTTGKTQLSKAVSIGWIARMMRGMNDAEYPPFTPEIRVSETISLESYGVEGEIRPLPGHTPGSLVVQSGTALFAGDLIRGGILFRGSATEHFYHEDRARARRQLAEILKEPFETIYPGHFGPLSAEQVHRDYLSD